MSKKKPPPTKPASGIRFLQSDESYAADARAQKQYIRDAADRIEHGASLDGMNTRWIANVLRDAADKIQEQQPRPRGRQPEIDPGGLALVFASMVVHEKMSVHAAHEALADQYPGEVSIEAIKKALKKYGDVAIRDAQDSIFDESSKAPTSKKTKS